MCKNIFRQLAMMIRIHASLDNIIALWLDKSLTEEVFRSKTAKIDATKTL